MHDTTTQDITQRPAWRWRPGTPERTRALREFADAFGEFAEENHGDHATERLYGTLINLMDLVADDPRKRRASR